MSRCSRSTWPAEETRSMNNRVQRACVFAVAVVAMAVPFLRVSGQMPVRAPRYAITNARIVTAAGPVIDKGTVVMRDGDHRRRRRRGGGARRRAGRRRHRAGGLPGPDRHVQHRGGRGADHRRAGGAGARQRRPGGAAAPRSPHPTASPGPIRSARPAPATSVPTSTRPRWSSSTAKTCGGWPRPASPRRSPSRHRGSSAARARS